MNSENHLDLFSEAYTSNFAYDLDNQLMLHWYPTRIAPKLNSGSLLELGLGHGYSTKVFSNLIDDYSVIDGSSSVIQQFRTKYPELHSVKIIHSFFEDFESTDKFDNIVMGFVLEHVNDPTAILKQFQRMLSENGKLFIAVPNATSLHRQLGLGAGLIEDMYQLSAADLELGHKRIFDVNSLTDTIVQSGLKIKSMEGIFLKPLTTDQLLKLLLPKEVLNSMMQLGVEYPELSNALLVECTV
ncbi:class I SAM-dependent methyltransferase [Planctobacterium marinum]|uniref:class I SAM-dependent methyltransferase n=1 Tax=Planctobacterium marinum TaxID=1631968 RepID=UPI001E476C5A|nr:class I SAM-dependent methyltransferase [Planctobacterium marinum]MCC2606116.1 class I SAM-dependent methyltransferase [Planctobacterium marinum]